MLENGRQLELGGAKQRALLAVLLLHANEVVSSDRLIDALWEDDAPETGRKALQVYVSQLRKALGKARIVTRSPGYRLEVEPDELDLARFQRLLEERPSPARRSPSGVARRWRTSPTSALLGTRSNVSRTCALPVSRTESKPTSPRAASPRSWASWRRSFASIRCASGCVHS